MNSIKLQLVVWGLLFALFGVGVIAQIYYGQRLQNRVMSQIEAGHKVINHYLAIGDEESKITADIRFHIDAKSSISVQEAEIEALRTRVQQWRGGVVEWGAEYIDWLGNSGLLKAAEHSVPVIVDEKKRQADGYLKAIELCLQNKKADAATMLDIENTYRPSAQSTVRDIFVNINNRLVSNRIIAGQYFLSTVLAVLLALGVLTIASLYVFRDVTRNLRALENGADTISRGDFERPIIVSGPVELKRLAESFNNMLTAIRSRDQQIRLNTAEIKKLNLILEGKLEDSNKKIGQQNETLKRKNKELEQILYTATHDLRTPLISIQGFGEELKAACEELRGEVAPLSDRLSERARQILDEEVQLSLNYILNGSKRMDILLDGLLRLSRMGRASVKPEHLEMNSLLRNVCDALNFQIQESGAKIQTGTLIDITGDASMIEQVFFNLISNAIKYRSPERPCEITVDSRRTEGGVIYAVKDNGLGISKENQQRVFDAFYRAHLGSESTGEGLGLAIVNRILDLHGGRIWVESDTNKGSRFLLELPDTIPTNS